MAYLLPNLKNSTDDKFMNAMKISLLAGHDDIWRRKAFTLLKHKNFDIAAGNNAKMISEISFDDLELVIKMDNDQERHHLKYFDNKHGCIDKNKNGIGKYISNSLYCIYIILRIFL